MLRWDVSAQLRHCGDRAIHIADRPFLSPKFGSAHDGVFEFLIRSLRPVFHDRRHGFGPAGRRLRHELSKQILERC
jgi:hypothetical protein